MIEKFVKWLAKEYISSATKNGYNSAKKEIVDQKQNILEFEIQESLGKKIIYCPNEWEDPMFAIVTGVDYVTLSKAPMITCKNVLTSEASMVFPGSFYYADELLTLSILKLNPFERWNLSVGKLAHMNNMWQKGYQPNHIINSAERLEQKLREVGFMFKSKETSQWLEKSVLNQNYLNYDFKNSSFVPTIHVKEKKTENPITEINFDSFEEMNEFKKILNLGVEK
jgi:hypothetical protein